MNYNRNLREHWLDAETRDNRRSLLFLAAVGLGAPCTAWLIYHAWVFLFG